MLPRVVDHHLGQVALGVWDFGWALVAYFGLVQAGIGSSVNRYVAKHRAAGDAAGLRCAMASVYCALLTAATIIALLSVGTSSVIGWLAAERLGEHVADARWVVLLLGMSLAIQTAFVVYGGVITGCHRWGLHNGITAGFYAISVIAMIVTLLLGGGLPAVAAVYCGGVVMAEIARAAVAYRICPELSVRIRFARWSTAREVIAFGGKAFFPRIAELLMNQTTSIFVLAYLGPSALALFSRPSALVRHVRTLVGKLAFVLTPTASSLQALQDHEQIRHLLVASTRYAAYIALPLILLLVILGDAILHVWMGPHYAAGLLLAVLAVGFFVTVTHQTILSVLMGLNAHGRPGIARLMGATCTVGLVALSLGPLDWGLVGVAVSVTLPLVIVDGVYLPVYACRRLSLPVRTLLFRAYRSPILCAIPFSLCLLAGRVLFADWPLAALGCGGGAGGLVLALTYWIYVLPDRFRTRMESLWTAGVGRLARARPWAGR